MCYFIFTLLLIISHRPLIITRTPMIAPEKKYRDQTVQSENNSTSSQSLSSGLYKAPQDAGTRRGRQVNHDEFGDLQIFQRSYEDSYELRKSLEEVRGSFFKTMAERKAAFQDKEDQGYLQKIEQLCFGQKQVRSARKPSEVQLDDNCKQQQQNVLRPEQNRETQLQRQHQMSDLKVRLIQQSQPVEQSRPVPSPENNQLQSLQSCCQPEQHNESIEIVSRQTFQQSFSISPNQGQQTKPKRKIIEPYLRNTIQVLSSKFRTPRSVELEYFWDLDHHRAWLTREEAKEQALSLYIASCTAETQTFFTLNGIKLTSLDLLPAPLFDRFKKIFVQILLQKVRHFEARRKKAVEEIRACKSQVSSQRLPSATKPWSKKKAMMQAIQGEPMSALQETIKLTQKYLMKSNNGSVVNIIVPNVSYVERRAKKGSKKCYFSDLSLSQAVEDKKELQSWIQSLIRLKEEQAEPEAVINNSTQ